MSKRSAEYTTYHRENVNNKIETVDHKGIGVFHQWGVDFCEFEEGPGNYTAGVIEKEDGTVVLIPAENILFLDSRPKQEQTQCLCKTCHNEECEGMIPEIRNRHIHPYFTVHKCNGYQST